MSVPSSLLLGCDDTLDWLEKNRSESEKKRKKMMKKMLRKKCWKGKKESLEKRETVSILEIWFRLRGSIVVTFEMLRVWMF